MRAVALIPAAGMGKRMGKRMGAGMNKQYLLLDGRPILAHTLEIFEEASFVDDIYVVIPQAEIAFCREQVVEKYGFTKVRDVIAGGSERQYSVLNGIRALSGYREDDVVIIHDGVRPFIPTKILKHSIEVASQYDGALVAVPAKDTVKTVEAGVVTGTPPRENIWLAQTPQSFRHGIISAAHEIAAAEGFLGTDDASLVERMGRQVHVVMGDYRNIKITTPEDMLLAETFLKK
ncbi:2-C-methyl-D-erythritol 4-phosphate cytidylyltransferase [Geotalea toluenoxydans]|uniref:2-C-methyl-D-erythritol 4-phosphate cytidylyltransferase n=1 Tax=Geotalea toluenoxydans TaxID=421624 RepID=UPI0006D2CB50|nr:2-C-methyl-D-erythritol 4-phosphate cytidylyltransferase [Geotalea toluenoxydans]